MSTSYKQAIVRIFDPTGAKIVGTGIAISGTQILTCAHVVAEAVGVPNGKAKSVGLGSHKDDKVKIDFPKWNDSTSKTKVAFYLYQKNNSAYDIAILEHHSGDPFPQNLKPAILLLQGSPDESKKHDWEGIGYPANEKGGILATGSIAGEVTNGLIQIDGSGIHTMNVAPGFSGGALFDQTLEKVIGITNLATKADDKQTAFVIPTQVIFNVLRHAGLDLPVTNSEGFYIYQFYNLISRLPLELLLRWFNKHSDKYPKRYLQRHEEKGQIDKALIEISENFWDPAKAEAYHLGLFIEYIETIDQSNISGNLKADILDWFDEIKGSGMCDQIDSIPDNPDHQKALQVAIYPADGEGRKKGEEKTYKIEYWLNDLESNNHASKGSDPIEDKELTANEAFDFNFVGDLLHKWSGLNGSGNLQYQIQRIELFLPTEKLFRGLDQATYADTLDELDALFYDEEIDGYSEGDAQDKPKIIDEFPIILRSYERAFFSFPGQGTAAKKFEKAKGKIKRNWMLKWSHVKHDKPGPKIFNINKGEFNKLDGMQGSHFVCCAFEHDKDVSFDTLSMRMNRTIIRGMPIMLWFNSPDNTGLNPNLQMIDYLKTITKCDSKEFNDLNLDIYNLVRIIHKLKTSDKKNSEDNLIALFWDDAEFSNLPGEARYQWEEI